MERKGRWQAGKDVATWLGRSANSEEKRCRPIGDLLEEAESYCLVGIRTRQDAGQALLCSRRNFLGKQKAKLYYTPVDEARKRVLLIAASILTARKLAQYDKP